MQPSVRESNGVVVGALEKGSGLLTATTNIYKTGFGSNVRVAETLDAAVALNQSYFFTVFVTPGRCERSFLFSFFLFLNRACLF